MSTFELFNPATGLGFRKLPADTGASINDKLKKARSAQTQWAKTSLADRLDCLRRFNRGLEQRADELAITMSTETGKPVSQARNEILATPGRINYFIENVERMSASRTPLVNGSPGGLPGQGAMQESVTYDPLGVIANISAWNYPYFVSSNVFAPALLCGNAVLYKPSECATLTGLAIQALLHESGIPEDVFAIVLGAGDAGRSLLEADIDGVFFTGSHDTGMKVASAAAMKLIPAQLELGGKDPVYVADDVDPTAAAEELAEGAFYNAGQSCCAVERIYVHRAVYFAFRAAFIEAVRKFRIGPPEAPETFIGPLTRESQLAVLDEQVSDAVAKGATLMLGGRRAEMRGWYFEPTVLCDVNHDMLVMREESFGPIIGIQEVASDDEAVAHMDDTRYGLTAAVYSKDRARAVNILAQVSSGTSYWNCCDRVSPNVPWTGRGHSGLGSTLSEEGIRAFLQPRGWHLRSPA